MSRPLTVTDLQRLVCDLTTLRDRVVRLLPTKRAQNQALKGFDRVRDRLKDDLYTRPETEWRGINPDDVHPQRRSHR